MVLNPAPGAFRHLVFGFVLLCDGTPELICGWVLLGLCELSFVPRRSPELSV